MSDPSLFAEDPTAGQRSYTVGALAAELGRALRREFSAEIWVEGEIRNLNRSAAGHVYFDLVDPGPPGAQPDATISVVLFRKTREVINRFLKGAGGQRMDDGMAVRIRTSVDFYPPQGRLQLQMTGIDPSYTLGRLAADRERILAALLDDDLIDANRRLRLPLLPYRIALITSAGSAAAEDFLSELDRSGLGWQVTVLDTRVQGFAAVEGICVALRRAAGHGELVAIVRGGGARTDLAAFDSEAVARAIAACQVPVITGIGHETDRSVADEVAALATKTPTAAAGAIIEIVQGVQRQVIAHTRRLAKITGRHLDSADQRLAGHAQRANRAVTSSARLAADRIAGCSQRLVRLGPIRLTNAERTIAGHVSRLRRGAPRALSTAEGELGRLDDSIALVDPANLLRRGWSIARDPSGRLLRRADGIAAGDTVVTTMIDGTVTSTVTATDPRGDPPP